MRNVLLVDIDSKIPNLALMKLSAHHKALGDQVYLNRCSNPDITYASCVFTWNRGKTTFYPEAKIGGTGIDLTTELPFEIEHIMPDYSLYGCDYSLGFTSRGCIRQCDFCVVPRKEGQIRDHSPLSEFINPTFSKVMLLDNNLLAAPCVREVLVGLAKMDLKVCFNQGLDIRLVTNEIASLLSHVDYRSLSFKERRLYFAFDDPTLESIVRRGIASLSAAGIQPGHLMWYILAGFNTTFEQDLHRAELIQSLGCDPFIMKYNNRQDPQLNRLARWANKPQIRKLVPFAEYSRRHVEALAV